MHHPAQRIATLVIAATVAGLGFGACPLTAHATSYQELQQQVEEATTAYNEAMERLAQVQVEIDQNQAEIDRIEEEIPQQRERAAGSLKTLYKMQQSSGGLIELVLTSDDFNQFVSTITYLDRIQSKNITELEALADLNAQLLEAKDLLNARKAQANQEVDKARQAQEDAVAAREAVRLQAIAQAQAEAAEAQAAIEEAAKEAEAGKTFTTASGQEAKVSTPSDTSTVVEDEEKKDEDKAEAKQEEKEPEPEQEEPQQEEPQQQEPAPAVSERDAYISKWAPRIDAYLAGSPLGGYGTTFAEAAWDYGVDPRWSPAISCVESSKGAVCFRPHNAWGWGNASWGDWDSAIRSHVAGLAAGYGYTISVSAAQQYCPPTWQAWYSSVLAEMNCI